MVILILDAHAKYNLILENTREDLKMLKAYRSRRNDGWRRNGDLKFTGYQPHFVLKKLIAGVSYLIS